MLRIGHGAHDRVDDPIAHWAFWCGAEGARMSRCHAESCEGGVPSAGIVLREYRSCTLAVAAPRGSGAAFRARGERLVLRRRIARAALVVARRGRAATRARRVARTTRRPACDAQRRSGCGAPPLAH